MSASKHKKMHSIQLQFAVFYVLLIVGVMVAALIMIRTFLPSSYDHAAFGAIVRIKRMPVPAEAGHTYMCAYCPVCRPFPSK